MSRVELDKEKGEEDSRQSPTSVSDQRKEKALFEEPKKVLCGQVKWGREWSDRKQMPKKVQSVWHKVAVDDQDFL